MAAVVAPIQIFAGDQHGLNTQEHQPAKIAAMEGHFETKSGASLILFGWPDAEAGETKYAIEIPKLGSLILKHSFDGTVIGLDQFDREDWPPLPIVFWSFRVMVGIGFLMLFFGLAGAVLAARKRLFESDTYLRWAVAMGPAGFVAILSGWFVSEVGRQPFVVYGLMRTADAVSPIGGPGVAASLIGFFVVYTIVFGAGTYYLLHLMKRPPSGDTDLPGREAPIRTASPGATPPGVLDERPRNV
ncbi:MAG: cytochrome ubiquinol oxidase subunit I, partial [Alphaproteobacteria bacterium]|nr:cytochrome ubiquinol oxidase subunit I [Alphaproteobacteria bacterium]